MAMRNLAFNKTQVQSAKTFADIEAVLHKHGIEDTRVTHRLIDGGSEREFTLEFIVTEARLAVRVQLVYPLEPASQRNSAARALYWFIKAKLDGIDYGIESAEVAWAAYLVGAGGQTIADEPERIAAAVTRGHVFALGDGR